MTEIEQALQQELGKLRTAVSYIEDANKRTEEALQAAADMQAQNAHLHNELNALHHRITEMEAEYATKAPSQRTFLLASIGSLLMFGCGSWLLKSK